MSNLTHQAVPQALNSGRLVLKADPRVTMPNGNFVRKADIDKQYFLQMLAHVPSS
jgi:hypothetical protein